MAQMPGIDAVETPTMKSPTALERQIDDCAHLENITGSSNGIKRRVCKNCGHVSVSYLGETVTKGVGVVEVERDDVAM